MIKGIWQQGLLKFVLHNRHNLRQSPRTPLLEATENVGDHLIKFLPGESLQTSGIFGFITSNLVLVPTIVDSTTLDIKYSTDVLEWNARRVLLAQNSTCVEALLAETCCRCKSLILLPAFDDLGVGRESHILPECAGQASHFDK
jgi:hypothetical protein